MEKKQDFASWTWKETGKEANRSHSDEYKSLFVQ